MLYFSEYLFINKDDYFDTLTATQYSGYVRWIKYFIRIIIKLGLKMLRVEAPQTRSFWRIYAHLTAFPAASTLIAAKHLSFSYNCFYSVCSLHENKLIIQGSNATRNRIREYSNLDFIFVLPSIDETTCVYIWNN